MDNVEYSSMLASNLESLVENRIHLKCIDVSRRVAGCNGEIVYNFSALQKNLRCSQHRKTKTAKDSIHPSTKIIHRTICLIPHPDSDECTSTATGSPIIFHVETCAEAGPVWAFHSIRSGAE